MNTFLWLVRREVWEHRGSLVRAPLILMSVFVVLALIGLPLGHRHLQGVPAAFWLHAGEGLQGAMVGAVVITALVMSISMFFYAAGSLHDERKDRSVLFWKSLPISDAQTVMAKASIPLLVAPAFALGIGLVGGLIVVALGLGALAFFGPAGASSLVASTWLSLDLGHTLLHLAALWPVYALSALPTVGWLMACSAWARNKPLLWALLLPLAAWSVWVWLRWMGVPLPSERTVLSHLLGGLWAFRGHGDAWVRWSATMGSLDLWLGALIGVALLAVATLGRRRCLDV